MARWARAPAMTCASGAKPFAHRNETKGGLTGRPSLVRYFKNGLGAPRRAFGGNAAAR
jgi:hypothetical protein